MAYPRNKDALTIYMSDGIDLERYYFKEGYHIINQKNIRKQRQ